MSPKYAGNSASVGVASVFATLVLPRIGSWARPENRTNLFEPVVAGEAVRVMTEPTRVEEFSFVSSRCGGFKHSERDVWCFQDEKGRNVNVPLATASALSVGDSVQILAMRPNSTVGACIAKKGT